MSYRGRAVVSVPGLERAVDVLRHGSDAFSADLERFGDVFDSECPQDGVVRRGVDMVPKMGVERGQKKSPCSRSRVQRDVLFTIAS